MDKWKSKNTYKIMEWADDMNFDYSDKRCSGDATVAVQLLPILATRGYLVDLSYTGANVYEWVCEICNKDGREVARSSCESTVSQAITAAVLKLVDPT